MKLCSIRTLRAELKKVLDHPTPTLVGDPTNLRAVIIPIHQVIRLNLPSRYKAITEAQTQANSFFRSLKKHYHP